MSMKFRNRRRCFSIFFFLLLFFTNFAAFGTQEASRYFDIGVQAAQQQQYHAALKAFLQAKSAGLKSPELNYNLGVIYYKLMRYEKSADSFRQLIHNEDYAAVAFYNLGLVDLKRGEIKTAKDWFLKANSVTTDPKLKSLSELALQRVNADNPTNRFLTGWSGFVSAGVGYDSNVSLIDEDLIQAQGMADYREEVSAAVSKMVWGTHDKGIQFSANGDILEQQTLHHYDFSQWHIALAHLANAGSWKTTAAAGIDRLRFANVPFQQLTSLEFRGVRRISKQTALELGYHYENIEDRSPNGIYDYLEGNLHRFRLKLTDKVKKIRLRYSYEIQLNDRKDYTNTTVVTNSTTATTTTTTTTHSYSPLRNIFQVTADVPLKQKLALLLGAQFRYSYYPDADTKTVTTQTSTGKNITPSAFNREDHRYKLNLGMQYSYNEDWKFFSYYSFTKNRSNRAGSAYRRSLVSAGVTWFF